MNLTLLIKAILYVWQLPQHLLGLLLVRLLKAKKHVWTHKGANIGYWRFERANRFSRFISGGSFGGYILLPQRNDYEKTVPHENGHSIQSKMLGPLYLVIIGLPSATGNLLARVSEKVRRNYYRLPWERWADILGGVDRYAPA